jgi:3-hydroxyacyl-[acyl-carrier-protein] dehydratase
LKKNNTPALTIEEILKILPHRHPFVMIDQVLEMSAPTEGSRVGRKAKAIKCISFGEPFFAGHFPHRPVMPGVLIVEALAQAAAIACWRPKDPQMDVAIARIGEVRVRRPVVPGDVLTLDVEVKKDRGDMIVIECVASVGSELVTRTEILASVTPASTAR